MWSIRTCSLDAVSSGLLYLQVGWSTYTSSLKCGRESDFCRGLAVTVLEAVPFLFAVSDARKLFECQANGMGCGVQTQSASQMTALKPKGMRPNTHRSAVPVTSTANLGKWKTSPRNPPSAALWLRI